MLEYIRRRFKYIFPLLILFLLAGLVLSRIYRPEPSLPDPEIRISASEAHHNIGRVAKVCGRVASASYVTSVDGKPTFLNLGAPHPDPYFTAVIWQEDRIKWERAPEKVYRNQTICITGRISRQENTPQIEVESPRQVEIVQNSDNR